MARACLYYFGYLILGVLACGIIARISRYFEFSQRFLYLFYVMRVFIDIGKFVGVGLIFLAALWAGHDVIRYVCYTLLGF